MNNSRKAAPALEEGLSYFAKRAYGAALRSFDHCIAQQAELGTAYYMRGRCHLLLHQRRKAVSDLALALDNGTRYRREAAYFLRMARRPNLWQRLPVVRESLLRGGGTPAPRL